MTSIAELINKVRQEGFEEIFNRYYSLYEGVVADNADPDYLGRVKLCCPAVYGDLVWDEWTYPRGNFSGKAKGFYAIPDKGDPIYVTFQKGDPSCPIWEHGWTLEENRSVTARDKVLLQYGDCRLEADRAAGTWSILTKEGKLTLTDQEFIVQTLNSSVLKVGELQVKLTAENLQLCGSSYSSVLGENLVSWLNTLLQLLAQLTAAGAPVTDASSAPIAASILFTKLTQDLAPASSLPLLSQKVKLS